MILSIIAALGSNRELGYRNTLPWRIPRELEYFKKTTMNHHLLFGRKTFESLRKPLPGRTSIVLSRQEISLPKEVICVSSLDQAWKIGKERGESELFICGGGEIYKQCLPMAHRLYLSLIDKTIPSADTYFPLWNTEDYDLIESKAFEAEEELPSWKAIVLESKR